MCTPFSVFKIKNVVKIKKRQKTYARQHVAEATAATSVASAHSFASSSLQIMAYQTDFFSRNYLSVFGALDTCTINALMYLSYHIISYWNLHST